MIYDFRKNNAGAICIDRIDKRVKKKPLDTFISSHL